MKSRVANKNVSGTIFRYNLVQPPFNSIDAVHAVILESLYFSKNLFSVPKLAGVLDVSIFHLFLIFSIPRAPSRSNHYVDNVGGYHKF